MDVSVANKDFATWLMVLVVMVILAARTRIVLIGRCVELQDEEQGDVIFGNGSIDESSGALRRQTGQKLHV